MKRILAYGALAMIGIKAADSPGTATFHFGISESLVAKNVTTAETRQAMTTWASEMKRQVPTFMTIEISIPPSNEIARKMKAADLDGIAVSSFEYASIAAMTDSTIMTNEASPEGEEYLLLVHKDSGISSLGELKGRKITLYNHPKMNIGRAWLELSLATAKLPAMDLFFSSVSPNAKVNLTVLSVFFKTSEACLVTKRSFATMTEMNPQIGAQLRPLSVSPKLIPSLLIFRKECPAPHRMDFEKALAVLKTAPAGQQALALFDGTGVVRADAAIMKPSLDVIAAYERLRQKTGSGGK